jgi:hypothetical protein
MPDGSATDQESIYFRRVLARSPLLATANSDNLDGASLPPQHINSLLPGGIHGWGAGGFDTAWPAGIDGRSGVVGASRLGMAAGNALWLDADAAGWAWLVDGMPWEGSAFTTPGDQGAQGQVDLGAVLADKTDRLPGSEHDADDRTAEALAAGTRRVPLSGSGQTDLAALDRVFADSGTDLAAPPLDGSVPRPC